MSSIVVRAAELADAKAVQAIYAPYVESTHISFELEPPSLAEVARRIEATMVRYPWLVAVLGDRVVGYGYGSAHSSRGAYEWSVDTSIYLHGEVVGRGVGTQLYTELLERLRTAGFVNAYAGIALPNEASVVLHERLGFTPIGVFSNAGYKLGRWIDVGWWHRPLSAPPAMPTPPRLPPEAGRVDPAVTPLPGE